MFVWVLLAFVIHNYAILWLFGFLAFIGLLLCLRGIFQTQTSAGREAFQRLLLKLENICCLSSAAI